MAALDFFPGRLTAAGPLSGAFAPEATMLLPSRREGGREGEPSPFARMLEEKQSRLDPLEARALGAPGATGDAQSTRTPAAEASIGGGRERPAERGERSEPAEREEYASAERAERAKTETPAKEPSAKEVSAAERNARRGERGEREERAQHPRRERDPTAGIHPVLCTKHNLPSFNRSPHTASDDPWEQRTKEIQIRMGILGI